jgi:hypothetical protein
VFISDLESHLLEDGNQENLCRHALFQDNPDPYWFLYSNPATKEQRPPEIPLTTVFLLYRTRNIMPTYNNTVIIK